MLASYPVKVEAVVSQNDGSLSAFFDILELDEDEDFSRMSTDPVFLGSRKSLCLDLPGRIHGQDSFFGEPGKQHPDGGHALFDRGRRFDLVTAETQSALGGSGCRQVRGPRTSASELSVLKAGHYHRSQAANPDEAEYFVPVSTVPFQDRYSEPGLFGNQNSVCQSTAEKWRNTVPVPERKPIPG